MKILKDIVFKSGEVITFLGSERSDLKSLAAEIKVAELKKGRNVVTVSKNLIESIFKDSENNLTDTYTKDYTNFQSVSFREDVLFDNENNLIIIADLNGLTPEQETFIFAKNYKASVVVLYCNKNALVRSAFSLDKHAENITKGSNGVIFARKYVDVSYSFLEIA